MKKFCLKVYEFFNGTTAWPNMGEYRMVSSNGDRFVKVEYDHRGKRVILFFEADAQGYSEQLLFEVRRARQEKKNAAQTK